MPHQQRSEETRARILQAALGCFSRYGYDASGVAEICAAAGVSKGAFYHHFPTKQAVFLELMEQWLAGLETAFQENRSVAVDVPQAIIQMANTAGQVLEAADVRLSIILEFWMQAYRDPAIWQAAIAPYRRFLAYFTELIQEGMRAGTLQAVDADRAARVTVSLALGLLMQAVFEPQGANWALEARESLVLLMNGLIKRSDIE